jgi:hypothetical protein
LLENPEVKKTWVIRIELSGGEHCEIRTSIKELATQEYNRIRVSGVYGGLWVTKIDMEQL